MVIARSRGIKFKKDEGGAMEPPEIWKGSNEHVGLLRDIAEWLGFKGQDEYFDALTTLKGKIFDPLEIRRRKRDLLKVC
jgi:hypothetical protein